MGEECPQVMINPNDHTKPELPDHYTIVPSVCLGKDDVFCPSTDKGKARPGNKIDGAEVKDQKWLEHVH